MKTIVPPESRAAALTRWRGAHATVWMFHATLRRLALILSRRDDPEVLYVVGVGCKHMDGPFSWDDADIVITQDGDEERVVDAGAEFELRCSSTTLVRGPSTDRDTGFDGFMGEDVPNGRG